MNCRGGNSTRESAHLLPKGPSPFVEPVALIEHRLGGKLNPGALRSFGWGCFGFPYKKKSLLDWGREVS